MSAKMTALDHIILAERDECRESDLKIWSITVEEATAELDQLRADVARLRLLIRAQRIEPPFDIADDLTTEFAVENAALEDKVARLTQEREAAQVAVNEARDLIAFYMHDHQEEFNCNTSPCDLCVGARAWLATRPAPEAEPQSR